jgi:hypothetical protein
VNVGQAVALASDAQTGARPYRLQVFINDEHRPWVTIWAYSAEDALTQARVEFHGADVAYIGPARGYEIEKGSV